MELENSTGKPDNIAKLLIEWSEFKKGFIDNTGIGDWINRKQAMFFLSYKDTAMAELEKSGDIEYSQIGRRKFFRKSAIIELLQKNIQKIK